MSAILQQGLDLLRQQHADAQADRVALRALLAEWASGPFVTSGEPRERLKRRARQRLHGPWCSPPPPIAISP